MENIGEKFVTNLKDILEVMKKEKPKYLIILVV
jgi:hypothetical protein